MSNFEANRIPILLAASMLASAIVGTVVVCLFISDMKASAKADTEAVAVQVSVVALDVAVIKAKQSATDDKIADLKDGQKAVWETLRTNTKILNAHSDQLDEVQKAAR